MTDRRTFVAVAGACLGAPAILAAQAARPSHRIGYLSVRAGPGPSDEAFLRTLADLGYVVGRNVAIEYRWADNRMERLKPLAEELVGLGVDVIAAATTPAVDAAMRTTRNVPIVMTIVSDPVRAGLVASLKRPGGNVTGPSLSTTDLARKRVELVRELVPGIKRIGLLAQQESVTVRASGHGPTSTLLAEIQFAARGAGISVVAQIVATPGELPKAFAELERQRAQALIVQSSPFALEHFAAILEGVTRQRLADMHDARQFVDVGGLVSYGPDVLESYRRAASYVDRILRGAKPADLPIEQLSKVELVVNARTAKARGLAVPPSVLSRADEVIQ